jgi:uncharacterized protein with FMN-binding domain
MRRIVTWAMSTLTVLVLLFSYHTSRSSVVATAEPRPVTRSTSQAAASGATAAPSSSTPSPTSTAPASSSAAGTYTGDAVDTRFGPVQVQITVASGRITAVDVLQVPMSDRHDQMINSQAVPVYNDETVQAQSASIDVVSGATYTWEGYTQSLQSAIDAAHL